jgi:hypothetical protein
VNWHDRSLAPERLWGSFYLKFLENLKKSKVWIDTASRATRWFDKRRSVSFDEVLFSQDKVKLRIVSSNHDDLPGLTVRIHTPKTGKTTDPDFSAVKEKHLDIHFTDVVNSEYPI